MINGSELAGIIVKHLLVIMPHGIDFTQSPVHVEYYVSISNKIDIHAKACQQAMERRI